MYHLCHMRVSRISAKGQKLRLSREGFLAHHSFQGAQMSIHLGQAHSIVHFRLSRSGGVGQNSQLTPDHCQGKLGGIFCPNKRNVLGLQYLVASRDNLCGNVASSPKQATAASKAFLVVPLAGLQCKWC